MASEQIPEYEAVSALNDKATFIEAMVERVIMETWAVDVWSPRRLRATPRCSVSVTAEVLSLDGSAQSGSLITYP